MHQSIFKTNYSTSCPNLRNDKIIKENSEIVLLFGVPDLKVITNIIFCDRSEYLNVCNFIYSSITADIFLMAIVTFKTNIKIEIEHLFKFTKSNDELCLFNDVTIEDFKNRDVYFLENTDEKLYSLKDISLFYLKYPLDITFSEKNEMKEMKKQLDKLSSCYFLCKSENIVISDDVEEQDNIDENIMKAKKGAILKEKLTFETHYLPKSKNLEQKTVPTIIQMDGNFDISQIKTILTILLPCHLDEMDLIHSHMKEAIKRIILQINLFYKVHKKFINFHFNAFELPNTNTFVNIINLDSGSEEENMNYRIHLHKIFNLGLDLPVFKISQAFNVTDKKSIFLRNPHTNIDYKPIGECEIVHGLYEYRHYMQDNFNDAGWGCAYRSFQTIWSWFALQGFIDKHVPTHKEIQQCLYDIGDKDSKFVGSKQWIGSTELSFCLETMLGINSRILSVSSGGEINELGREILYHFKNNGAPIMIGGGQLAHTIIGIDFNDQTGNCKFLILDPHYTGGELLDVIIKKGWCGWKDMNFWDKNSFYNLLLPINPSINC
uniref:Ufm1-specific protease n=1 Tax=Parastrongyloides trichosuri TaxID=131310 RepID=A0A0N4ZRZ2_PARTI